MTNRTPVPQQFQSQGRATERQVSFIADLMDRKDLFACTQWFDAVNAMDAGEYAAHIARVKEQAKTVSRKRASEIIDTLIALPDKPREEMPEPTLGNSESRYNNPYVPQGRYAIEHEGVLKFYRVDRPTEGRWEGYTFVKVQASDELYSLKGQTARDVLALIAREPTEAMQRYGMELGHCGRCGRTLTDETSRALGIGPVCRGEMGL